MGAEFTPLRAGMRIWPVDGGIEWPSSSTSLDRKERYSPQLGGGGGGEKLGVGMDAVLFMGCHKALEVLGNSNIKMLPFSPESQPVALPCPTPSPPLNFAP